MRERTGDAIAARKERDGDRVAFIAVARWSSRAVVESCGTRVDLEGEGEAGSSGARGCSPRAPDHAILIEPHGRVPRRLARRDASSLRAAARSPLPAAPRNIALNTAFRGAEGVEFSALGAVLGPPAAPRHQPAAADGCCLPLDVPEIESHAVVVVPAARVIRTRMLSAALGALVALSAASNGCADSRQARRYNRQRIQESLTRLETPGLVIGEFALARKAVLDGDTIRVEGLDSTMRLLGLDCEETIKNEGDRRQVEDDWPHYLQSKRGSARKPIKAGTPMGEEGKHFAQKFFAGVDRVRLERDDPKEIRDRFDRYLAYAFVRKGGRWINYNVEAVRAGISPYFTKYSYSRRYHDDLAAAEKEAREAQRGIWSPRGQHYTDYPERQKWWNARAGFIKMFEKDARGRDDFIVLTHWDSLSRLSKKVGQEVTVLGTVEQVTRGDRGPSRVTLSRRRFADLTVVFFDKDVFASTGIDRYKGEFVRISGVVSEYQNEYNRRRDLQLVVNLPSQVVVSDVPGLETPAHAASHP